MAGKYLSSPVTPALSRSSSQRQRGMLGPQRRVLSSEAAGTGRKNASLTQQEHMGYFSTGDRHVLTNRNLIYRDVKAFLNEVGGDPREARYWLTQFQKATSTQSPAFAVLEVRHPSILNANSTSNSSYFPPFSILPSLQLLKTDLISTVQVKLDILRNILQGAWENYIYGNNNTCKCKC